MYVETKTIMDHDEEKENWLNEHVYTSKELYSKSKKNVFYVTRTNKPQEKSLNKTNNHLGSNITLYLTSFTIFIYFVYFTFTFWLTLSPLKSISLIIRTEGDSVTLFNFFDPNLNKTSYTTYVLIALVIFDEVNLLITMILLITTETWSIPDNSFWNWNNDSGFNPQELIENNAVKILQISDQLHKSNNKIYLLDWQQSNFQKTSNTDVNIFSETHATAATSVLSKTVSVNLNNFYIINERTKKGLLRYCKYCQKIKPDRCYHCKVCNICALKFDHHNVVFNTCISWTNYKFYCLFLFYTWNIAFLFLFLYQSIFIRNLHWLSNNSYAKNKAWSTYSLLFCGLYLLTGLICFSNFVAWVFNVILVWNNNTLREYIKAQKAQINNIDNKDYSRSENSFHDKSLKQKSIYDGGMWNNWIDVFGNNILMWFIPIKKEINEFGFDNGINYKIQNNAQEIVKSV